MRTLFIGINLVATSSTEPNLKKMRKETFWDQLILHMVTTYEAKKQKFSCHILQGLGSDEV